MMADAKEEPYLIPLISLEQGVFICRGYWGVLRVKELRSAFQQQVEAEKWSGTFDLSQLGGMDMAGALVLQEMLLFCDRQGVDTTLRGLANRFSSLLKF